MKQFSLLKSQLHNFKTQNFNNIINTQVPEIAGVSTPSPITIQVPIKARIRSTFCSTLCFSNVDFKLDPKALLLVETTPSLVYSDSSSSASWQLGKELTRACRDNSEYRAKVPPSPLSSALSTINTYFTKGISVSVQNTKERTP